MSLQITPKTKSECSATLWSALLVCPFMLTSADHNQHASMWPHSQAPCRWFCNWTFHSHVCMHAANNWFLNSIFQNRFHNWYFFLLLDFLSSLFQYVLYEEFPSFVRRSHKWPTCCVGKSKLLPHLLPELEFLWCHIFFHLYRRKDSTPFVSFKKSGPTPGLVLFDVALGMQLCWRCSVQLPLTKTLFTFRCHLVGCMYCPRVTQSTPEFLRSEDFPNGMTKVIMPCYRYNFTCEGM